MRVFPIGLEHALDVPIERPQDADARMHHRPATLCRHDQHLGRGLPFREVLLGLRKFHDVAGRILERDQLTAARQRYRIVEFA